MRPKAELLTFTRSLPGSRSESIRGYSSYLSMQEYLDYNYRNRGLNADWAVSAYQIKENIFILDSEEDSFYIVSFFDGETEILEPQILNLATLLFNINKYKGH